MKQESNCYLCDRPATHPLTLKSTFTSHNQAACPSSDKMCDRCYDSMEGAEKLLWYWNEGKGKWSKLWGRSLSVSALPTRAEMRTWLLHPPAPPFTIVIAESGKKHILPWAKEAHSSDRFPVQFELDSLWIDRAEFQRLIGLAGAFEQKPSVMPVPFSLRGFQRHPFP